jgi:maleate cis-trans isomerase
VDLPRLAPGEALELGRAVLATNPEADTLLFPCPHWPVVDAIAPLEEEFGINVVTNLQATLWQALGRLGLTDPIPGFGKLLAGPIPMPATDG